VTTQPPGYVALRMALQVKVLGRRFVVQVTVGANVKYYAQSAAILNAVRLELEKI
jgi:hypothetical protein